MQKPQKEVDELRQQLAEARSTLDAIRAGVVDAVMVDVGGLKEVYTLQSAELPYREFVEQMAEGALSTDREFAILYCNEFLCTLLGRKREELLGHSILGWLDDKSRAALALASERDESCTLASTLRGVDKQEIPVQLSVVPTNGHRRRRINMVITDLRPSEDLQLATRAHQVAKAENDAKDRFLAVLGHELRNPLSALTSSVAVLQLGVSEPQRTRVQGSMARQLRQLKSLVDDLLDVTRVAQGKIVLKKEVVSLAEVLAPALEAVQRLVEQKRHVLTIVGTENITLEADRTRLEQVLINLLTNAARYTPEGGHIQLTAREHDSQVEVEVVDDGIGVAGESLEHIFEPFTQLGEEGIGGLGIGLSLVRQLVQLHDGNVVAESAGDGRGATFRVCLPQGKVKQSEASCQTLGNGAKSNGLRVLVVDDHEDAAELLLLLLEARGCIVETVLLGEAVGAAVESFKPALLLLDLGLPDVPGYVVAERLRAAGYQQLVIVAITGFSHNGARVRVRDSGFDAHLVKPVSIDQLMGVIEQFRNRFEPNLLARQERGC